MLQQALIVLGHGADLIKSGQQDIVIAGGGEDLSLEFFKLILMQWAPFRLIFNDNPSIASRAYDKK